jgi:ribonucleoside-diphosphate reductase alpha chain
VRLSSSHLPLLKDVQRLLLNFGIAGRIYEQRRPGGYRPMPDGQGGVKEYYHRAQHELAIGKTNLIDFANTIGFLTEAKQNRLNAYLGRARRGRSQRSWPQCWRRPDSARWCMTCSRPIQTRLLLTALLSQLR